jgi:hypothetical protein
MNRVLWLVRKLMRLPPPQFSREQAVAAAVGEAIRRGLAPIQSMHHLSAGPKAVEGLREWTVWLEPDFRPSRMVLVDNHTGQVTAFVAPRR